MPKQATAKLTSEERCRKAFERVVVSQMPGYDETWPADLAWWMGWKHCWNYLQTTVTKEFIES